MPYRTLKIQSQSVLLFFLGIVFFLASLKPWIDYLTPINYQLITLVQFLLLIFTITILNKSFYKHLDFISLLLASFILIRFLQESLIDLIDLDYYGIVSSIYVVLRIFLLIYLFQFLYSKYVDNLFFLRIRKFIFSYFILTSLYSVLQHPLFFGFQILQESGGNLISGNALGFFRANGAIGGTVIDYANYLLSIFWILMFVEFKNKYLYYFLLIIFFICTFLCFSRALFLAIAFILFLKPISFSNTRGLLVTASFLLIAFFILIYSLDNLITFYILWSGESDTYRVEQWLDLFKGFSFIDYLWGKELGGNTGLFIGGDRYKISGDGYIFGSIYDMGFIGIFLTLLFIFWKVIQIKSGLKVKLSIIGSLLVMLLINSGFEKLFIVMSYILSISLIFNYFETKSVKQ